MSPGDAAFLAGMVVAPSVLVLVIVAVVRLPPGRARQIHVAVGSACAIVLVAAVVSTGWWWGVGFEEVEARGVASRATDRAMVASCLVAGSAFVGVALAGTTAAVARLRSTPTR